MRVSASSLVFKDLTPSQQAYLRAALLVRPSHPSHEDESSGAWRRVKHGLEFLVDSGLCALTLLSATLAFLILMEGAIAGGPGSAHEAAFRGARLPLAAVFTAEWLVRLAVDGAPRGESVKRRGAVMGAAVAVARQLPDAFLVAVGWVEAALDTPQTSPFAHITSLRALRLLPLLAHLDHVLPCCQVRLTFSVMEASLEGLCDVGAVLLLSVTAFALMGLQLWVGVPGEGENLPFSDISYSLLNSFIVLVQEGWSNLMFFQASVAGGALYGAVIAVFFLHLFVGSWMVLQLTLAVVYDKLEKSEGFQVEYAEELLTAVQRRMRHSALRHPRAGPLHARARAWTGLLLGLPTSPGQHARAFFLSDAAAAPNAGAAVAAAAAAAATPAAAAAGAAPSGDFVRDGAGPFARRRRLSAVVDVAVVEGALTAVAAAVNYDPSDYSQRALTRVASMGSVIFATNPMLPLHSPRAESSSATVTVAVATRAAGGKSAAPPLPPLPGSWWLAPCRAVRGARGCRGGGAEGAPRSPPTACAPLRDALNSLRDALNSPMSKGFMLGVALVNVIVFCLEGNVAASDALDAIDAACVTLYVIEMLLQLAAGGFVNYFSVGLRGMEAATAVAGVLEFLITRTSSSTQRNSIALLRSVRVARLVGLLQLNTVAWEYMAALAGVIPEASGALASLVCTALAFALVGRQLFFYGVPSSQARAYASDILRNLPLNFSSLTLALLSVFQVVDNENWSTTLFYHVTDFGAFAALFFIAVIVVGSFLFLNIFVSLLLLRMQPVVHSSIMREKQKGARDVQLLAWLWGLPCCKRLCACYAEPDGAVVPRSASPAGSGSSDDGEVRARPTAVVTMNTGPDGSADVITMTLITPGEENHRRLEVWQGGSSLREAGATEKETGFGIEDVYHRLRKSCCRNRAPTESITPGGTARLNGGGGSSSRSGSGSSRRFAFGFASAASSSNLLEHATMVAEQTDVLRGLADPHAAHERRAAGAAVREAEAPRALFCLRHGNPVRTFAVATLADWRFQLLSFLMVVLSCINLGLDEPRLQFCDFPDQLLQLVGMPKRSPFCRGPTQDYISGTNFLFAAFFSLELVLECVARGFLLHRGSLLVTEAGTVSMWGLMDVMVVVVSLLSVLLSGSPGSRKVSFLRSANVLRAMKLIKSVRSLRSIVSSLVMVVPSMLPPLLVLFFFTFSFSVVGLQNMRGYVFGCNTDTMPASKHNIYNVSTTRAACTGEWDVTGDSVLCMLQPTALDQQLCKANSTGAFTVKKAWEPFYFNFETVMSSMMASFELLSGENWPAYMTRFLESSLSDDPTNFALPLRAISSTARAAVSAYFVLSQLLLNSIIAEVFVSAVVLFYVERHKELMGLHLLTDEQKVMVQNARRLLLVQPSLRLRPLPLTFHAPVCFLRGCALRWVSFVSPNWVNRARVRLFNAMQSPLAAHVTTALVLGNIAQMAVYDSGGRGRTYLDAIDLIFTWTFFIEALLRLLALGARQYFSGEKLDFSIAVGSVLAELVPGGGQGARTARQLLRLTRILRLVRIFRKIKGAGRIFRALLGAANSLLSAGAILLLILFFFAVVGMNLFSGVHYGWLGFLDKDNRNFDSFSSSFVNMLVFVTGENFNGVMHELSHNHAPGLYCVANFANYTLPPGANFSLSAFRDKMPYTNCGFGPAVTAIFWVLFYFTTVMFIMALVTGIVIEAFRDTADDGWDPKLGLHKLTDERTQEFKALWDCLDPDGTHLLEKRDVQVLIALLPKPLGLGGRSVGAGGGGGHGSGRGGGRGGAPSAAARLSACCARNCLYREPYAPENPPIDLKVAARKVMEMLPLVPTRQKTVAGKSLPKFHFHQVLFALIGRANKSHGAEAIHLSGEISTAELPLYVFFLITSVQRRWKRRRAERARRAAAATPVGAAGGGSRAASPSPERPAGLRLNFAP